jgi:hypothetical protein
MTAPLFPSESEIAVLVLGAKRARDWPAIARHLELKAALPLIDAQMGGRYWPAVEAYFQQRSKTAVPMVAPSRAPPRIPIIRASKPGPEKT